jgi:predicted peptidase
MQRQTFLITLLFLFSAIGIKAQSLVAHKGKVKDGYNFWLYQPKEINTPKPVVIFLHGASLCGRDMNKVRRYGTIDAVEKGRQIEAFVLAPQNPGGAWKPEKLMNVLDWVKDNHKVDTTRIYVLGMSLGGYGTIDFAATYPDKVAAAMAICGGGSVKGLERLSEVPLWIIHGTADKAVAIKESDRVAKIIKDSGDDSRLIYTRLNGVDHGKPGRIFYMLQTYDWLFSHSIKDEGRPVCRDFEMTVPMLNTAYQDLGTNEDYLQNSFE